MTAIRAGGRAGGGDLLALIVAGILLIGAGATVASASDAAAALGPAASASEGGSATVEPDRPSVSTSARTVPPGTLQLEVGGVCSRERVAMRPPERRLSLEATARAGLTERLEARLEGEPIVDLRGAADATDHGDLVLALKYRFVDAGETGRWPSLGVRPFVKLPLAQAPIGSGRPDFGAIGLASVELPWRSTLDVNAGAAVIGQTRPTGSLVQGLASAALARELSDRLSAFVEIFFASRDERDGRDALGVDTGATYRLTRAIALDAAVQTSLAGVLPDVTIRAGLTLRLGR